MEDAVRKLNLEYGFEEEIQRIAKQAQDAEKLFQSLFEVDQTGVMPVLKLQNKGKAK
jgi:hypothetical protein